ncbi:MAG: PEP-CTERM sorting domain-containing protein [Verrucomicrobiaceae bacterium]|nr:MAG: PEP-CTERM sorting domain-containing protein [Verrucomicrobiaceae bacterium]
MSFEERAGFHGWDGFRTNPSYTTDTQWNRHHFSSLSGHRFPAGASQHPPKVVTSSYRQAGGNQGNYGVHLEFELAMQKKPSLKFPSILRMLAVLAAAAPFSHGALLVHEGFAGYGTGELNGKAASTESTGLSGSWNGSSYGNRHQLTESGLTFSGLATNGGALTTGNDVRLSGIAMDHAGVATGGTLYSSYLVNLSGATNSGSGLLTRVNGTSTTQASGYFNAFADGRASTQPAVSYDTTFDPANHTAGSSVIPTGQTFIIISSFTNVGSSSGGTASLYVLSQAQFLNLRTIGLENLATLTAGQGTTEAWATASASSATFNGSFDSGDFLHILSLSSSSTIDEIRYGTSLEAVLPVPEPSGMAVAGIAILGMIGRRKRKMA